MWKSKRPNRQPLSLRQKLQLEKKTFFFQYLENFLTSILSMLICCVVCSPFIYFVFLKKITGLTYILHPHLNSAHYVHLISLLYARQLCHRSPYGQDSEQFFKGFSGWKVKCVSSLVCWMQGWMPVNLKDISYWSWGQCSELFRALWQRTVNLSLSCGTVLRWQHLDGTQ